MKALYLETINGFTFLAHGWHDEKNKIVCGCFCNGERAIYNVKNFKVFDEYELNNVHNINFKSIK